MDPAKPTVAISRRNHELKFDLETVQVRLRALSALNYYNQCQHSVSLFDDATSEMGILLTLRRREPSFGLCQWYAALSLLFGESTTMFDDYKSSFGYCFSLDVMKAGIVYPYVFGLQDVKGGIRFGFRRLVKPNESWQGSDRDVLRRPLETEFSDRERQHFIFYFTGFLVGYLESFQESGNKSYPREFIRFNAYAHVIYGFADGAFFEDHFEEYEDYMEALRQVKLRGLPLNEVRPNPVYPS